MPRNMRWWFRIRQSGSCPCWRRNCSKSWRNGSKISSGKGGSALSDPTCAMKILSGRPSIIHLRHCLRRDPKWSCSCRSVLLQSGVEKSPHHLLEKMENQQIVSWLELWIGDSIQDPERVRSGVVLSRKQICQLKGWGNRRFSDLQNCPIHLLYLEWIHENWVDDCVVHPFVEGVGSLKQTSMFCRCPIQINILAQQRMKLLWLAKKTRHLGFQPTHGIRRLFKVTMPPWLEIKSKHVTHRVNIQKLSWSLVASAAVNPGRPWSCSGVQSAFGPESWRNFNLLYSPQDGLAAPYATCPLAAKRNIQNMHFRIQQNVKW